MGFFFGPERRGFGSELKKVRAERVEINVNPSREEAITYAILMRQRLQGAGPGAVSEAAGC